LCGWEGDEFENLANPPIIFWRREEPQGERGVLHDFGHLALFDYIIDTVSSGCILYNKSLQ
jgi:hypothetical protein